MTKKSQHTSKYLLDRVSQKDIRLSKQRFEAIYAYHWEQYCYYTQERSKIYDELMSSLQMNCCSFSFSNWQRVVTYKYSLDPLSAKGSVLNDPGGRFNIGAIDPSKFSKFPALYLAEDRGTAYKEKFGLEQQKNYKGLTAEDLLLTRDESITIVTLQGKIEQVINLNDKNALKDFLKIIKNIEVPKKLIKKARQLNISPIYSVKTIKTLYKTILDPNWRDLPLNFDVPANSQILGQISHAAGIEGILYPSRKTGENCLAIFPENFANSSSYVEIVDPVPAEIKCRKLDEYSYDQCY